MRRKKLFNNSALFSAKTKEKLRAFFIFCCVFLCPNFGLLAESSQETSSSSATISAVNKKIYFYNPEINIARNLVLKSAWDEYLDNGEHLEFQPVDDEADFIRLVHNSEDAAFIMADWFYSTLFLASPVEKDLEVAFQGIRDGKDTYSKILVANKGALDFENVTIACSGSKARAQEILKSIYPELSSFQLEKLNILLVPKDIDALMAVGYGLAEMALSTEVSLLKMSGLNESIYKDMIVLRESRPLKRSVLVFKSTNSAFKRHLSSLLMNMTNTTSGLKSMSLLGLDEWKLKTTFSSTLSNNITEYKNIKGGHNNDN